MGVKRARYSVTMWVNSVVIGLTIIAYVLAAIQGGELPLPVEMPPEWIVFGLALVNLLLRYFRTSQPLR